MDVSATSPCPHGWTGKKSSTGLPLLLRRSPDVRPTFSPPLSPPLAFSLSLSLSQTYIPGNKADIVGPGRRKIHTHTFSPPPLSLCLSAVNLPSPAYRLPSHVTSPSPPDFCRHRAPPACQPATGLSVSCAVPGGVNMPGRQSMTDAQTAARSRSWFLDTVPVPSPRHSAPSWPDPGEARARGREHEKKKKKLPLVCQPVKGPRALIFESRKSMVCLRRQNCLDQHATIEFLRTNTTHKHTHAGRV